MHPYLLQHGSLMLPSFGVLAAVGLMLALGLSERTARLVGLPAEKLWDAGLFTLLAAFLLSRGLLVATNLKAFAAFPLLLLMVPSLTPVGLLLTLVVTLGWLYWKHIPILRALDAWAPCAMLAWVFLALGHFAEGSDPGMPFAYGIRVPGEQAALHPIALYAAGLALVLTLVLYARLLRPRGAGETAGLALMGAGLAQFLLTFLRQPGLQFGTTQDGLDALQYVALAMIVAGTFLLTAGGLRRTAVSAD